MRVEVQGQYRRKIKTVDEVRSLVGPRPRDRTVVMCHGTFDLVHPGHVRHLIYARGKADVLVVSLTCDEHVTKANYRPFVPEDLRAMNLAALEVVDYVLIDYERTPLANLAALQPDFFAKGYEYVAGQLNPRTAEEMAVVEAYGGEMLFTPGDVVYSSSAIIEEEPPDLGTEKLIALLQAEGLTFEDLHSALDRLGGRRVHVVGDTIVDTLTETSLIGAVGKTPTFSTRFEARVDFVGGAGVVSKHLAVAGATVRFSTVLGDDALKDLVLADLAASGVETDALVDSTRPTTNKNAFVADGYRLLKVDTVDNRSISDSQLGELAESVRNTGADGVVFSDFRHGIFNGHTIPELTAAIPQGRFRVADSQVASRWGNILDFSSFDLLTPNEKEARFALGDQDTGLRPLGTELYERAKCSTLILKAGPRGLMAFRRPLTESDYRSFFVVDSFVDRLIDPVGSGDALLAYATLSLMSTGNAVIAAILGSFAAAVECEHNGNVPVRVDEVRAKLERVTRKAEFS